MTATAATEVDTVTSSLVSREWLAPLIAGVLVCFVGLTMVDALPVGAYFDDGMYVILAKAIATGQGYRWLHVPGAPPAVHFPPGYPIVLAALWKLFPDFPANVLVFKIANVCFLAAAAAATTVFARRRFAFSRAGSAALGVGAAIGIPTLVLALQVMSEPLFLALLLPTLLAAEHLVAVDARSRDLIVLGLVVAAITLVRSHGIAIAGAVVLPLLAQRRFRDVALFSVALVVGLLPWQLWTAAQQGAVPAALGGNYETYARWLIGGLREDGPGLFTQSIAKTTRSIGQMFGVFTAPGLPNLAQRIAAAAVLGTAACGVPRMWRQARVTLLFMVLYLVIVLLWPFRPERFVWCIWPLIGMLPVLGGRAILHWRPAAADRRQRLVRVAAIGIVCAIALGYARYTVRGYRGQWWAAITRTNSATARPLVQWVRRNTGPNEVIASNIEPMIYLYTNRRAVPVSAFNVNDYFDIPTVNQRSASLRAILAAYHVDVVAVESDSLLAAARQMAAASAVQLRVRDSLPNGVIFTPLYR